MLLLYLIHYDILASNFSEFGVDKSSRNGNENKHIEEDEDDEKDVVGLIVLNC